MTNLHFPISTRKIWISALALAALVFLTPCTSQAQVLGSFVNACSTGWVDSGAYIEQTVCLSGDKSELQSYIQTDDFSWQYLPWDDDCVVGVKSGGQLFDRTNLVFDSGVDGQNPFWITPTLGAPYKLVGEFAECYDPTCTGNFSNCSWGGTMSGQQVEAKVTSEGLLFPKFVVLDVLYAPPGSGSTMQYGNSTTSGNTTTNSTSFSQGLAYGTSTGVSISIPGGSTGYSGSVNFTSGSSQETTQTETYSDTITMSKSATATDTIHGYATSNQPSGIQPGDHRGDSDLIELWLNPELDFYAVPADPAHDIGPAIYWNGYSWDPASVSGNNTFGGIYRKYIHVGCLNGDWQADGDPGHANTCANEQLSLNRDWAQYEDQNLQTPTNGVPLSSPGCSPQTSNSPSICPNTEDAYQILKADPLAYNPGYPGYTLDPRYPPQTTSDGHYTQLCWKPNNQPNSNPSYVCPNNLDYTSGYYPSFNLTYMNNWQNSSGKSTSIKSSTTVSARADINFMRIFGISNYWTQTNTLTQTSSWNNMLSQTQTQTNAFSIQPDSPNYGAPGYLVYQDNFFGTWVFVPYNP